MLDFQHLKYVGLKVLEFQFYTKDTFSTCPPPGVSPHWALLGSTIFCFFSPIPTVYPNASGLIGVFQHQRFLFCKPGCSFLCLRHWQSRYQPPGMSGQDRPGSCCDQAFSLVCDLCDSPHQNFCHFAFRYHIFVRCHRQGAIAPTANRRCSVGFQQFFYSGGI